VAVSAFPWFLWWLFWRFRGLLFEVPWDSRDSVFAMSLECRGNNWGFVVVNFRIIVELRFSNFIVAVSWRCRDVIVAVL
jgi:hypothetical protein